jgi:3-oxoacyl-[acyl-carrier protein] reductase
MTETDSSQQPTSEPRPATSARRPVALVTGGSRGIGAAICRQLAAQGFLVAINYASSEGAALALREELRARGAQAETCGFDVSDSSQVDEKLDWIHRHLGPIQVLVNNAGITSDSLLLRLKDEDLDKVLAIDLKGAIYCTRAVAKQMLRERRGSIIQISSVVAEMGNPGQAAYCAAKAGLIGFSKSCAKELASRGIRVNVVTPGFIQTEMTEALTTAQKEAILQSIPLGYLGSPEDVASLVSFLASPESRYLTGQVIGVNGGLYM